MKIGKREYGKEEIKRVRINQDNDLIFDCKPEKENLNIGKKYQSLNVLNESYEIYFEKDITIACAELLNEYNAQLSYKHFPRGITVEKEDSLIISFSLSVTGPVSPAT